MKKYLKDDWFLYLIFMVVTIVIVREMITSKRKQSQIGSIEKQPDYWIAPSLYSDNTTTGEEREMIIYGQDLIANTSRYLGPQGSVNQITSGMNC